MMECWVELGDGSVLTLPDPIAWTFSYGTGLPCDSFFLRCLWQSGQERELSAACRFYAAWQGERVFTGVVDEYRCLCGESGTWLELSGRGMAALLLDNEALPAQYQQATAEDILERHVTPYGIQTLVGVPLPEVREFSVDSGVSEWSVLWQYACFYGGVVPRFDRQGRLVLDRHDGSGVLAVDDDTWLMGWEYREDRHGALSQVAVRRGGDGALQWVDHPEFLAQGGCARRVMSLPSSTGTASMRYTGDYQLRVSHSDRVRLELTLAGAFPAWPGQTVTVERSGFGANGRYRVAQVEVSCSDRGLVSVLTLARPEDLI